jgi:hypothetical protein
MTRRKSAKPPLSEENLALEVSEDNKLRKIGLDPDMNPIDLMIELDRRMAEYRKQRAREDAQEAREAAEQARLEAEQQDPARQIKASLEPRRGGANGFWR